MTQAETIVDKLASLGVPSTIAAVSEGPQIVRVELLPGANVRMHDYRRLSRADDLAFALGVSSVRILAPIPGRSVVGVEFPREDRRTVRLDDLPDAHDPLTVPIGIDSDNRPVLLLIPDAPHVLIAGATGSGKSTMLNAILVSLLRVHGPDRLRLCLIDPKRVELRPFSDLPHLVARTADTAQEGLEQLAGMIQTMEDRYELMAALGARDLPDCNRRLEARGMDPLPYLLVVIDELAELMMTSRKEAESLLVRLAQKGRAGGIHLILSTQSPRVDVVTGLLKINVPTRIGFSVPTMTDSRVILDANGCETLLARGDALFSMAGLAPVRLQGAYVDREEISAAVSRWGMVRV